MQRYPVVLARAALVLLALGAPQTMRARGDAAISGQDKVHPLVLEGALAGPVEFLIFLDEQADLEALAPPVPQKKEERGRRVHEVLSATARRTQAPLIEVLEARGLEYRPFWIANMIWARGDLGDVAALAARSDVRRIDANPRVSLALPESREGLAPEAIEWGVVRIRADQVWGLGHDGTGVVVGGQDTGYAWSHPALIGHYRGWNGTGASHDYHWHDAIHSGGGMCGADSLEPCDDYGHGTHTMGTMVGDDGGANRIGVAPGAKWIGCRNMDQGNGTPATYAECFQWFVAPTDAGGRNPDPARAPHVINNSWGCPAYEGCSADTLRAVVENTRAAGIVVVASAGNSGSACGTVSDPPAIYAAAFTVGATNSSDLIASFSSRGPVTADASNRLKPDVAAPGVGVRSSVPGGGYGVGDGTSMAGPHVAGLVALLLGARPDLAGRVDEVEEIVRRSAAPRTSLQQCGGIPGRQIPNPVFGWGRVDALAAVTGDIDGDGATTIEDCRPLDASVWSAPGPALGLHWTPAPPATALAWSPPAAPGGVLGYDVLRSTSAGDFSIASCLASNISELSYVEPDNPQHIFCYLVRAETDCGGSLGAGSSGAPRQGASCP